MVIKINKSLIPAMLLIFCIGIILSCSSSRNSNNISSNDAAISETAQSAATNASNQANAKENPREMPETTSAKALSESNILGKYECCEIGVEGMYSLDLKSNNAAAYKQVNEDSDGSGTGSWNWDEKKDFISVNLTVKSSFVDGETLEEKTATEKVTFKLKKTGKDLQIVKETLSPKELDGYFIGKTFKKL